MQLVLSSFFPLFIDANHDFKEALSIFSHYITPSFFSHHLHHTMNEGEKQACEEVISLFLVYSTEILYNIRQDIRTMSVIPFFLFLLSS